MLQRASMTFSRTLRCFSLYNPASAFAPCSNSMLVTLSMQHAIGGASSHSELVSQLQSSGLLRSEAVRLAFAAVDRDEFVPPELTDPRIIYDNRAIRYGDLGSLCSPSMQIIILEHLQTALGQGKRALDIGTGSGSMAVLMAEMGADVDAIDIDPELVASTTQRHRHDRIRWSHQDAFQLQAGKDSFECIHVGACVDFVPDSWLDMLKVGGTMLVPIGHVDCEQTLMKIMKTSDVLDGRHVVLRHAIQTCKYESMRVRSADMGKQKQSEACRAEIKQDLRDWYQAFTNNHGRKPNLNDMKSDVRVSDLLSKYRKQSKPNRT